MLVLASQSPRRKELLQNAGFDVIVRPSRVPEERAFGESPAAYVERLAAAKAHAAPRDQGEIVLGADTVVVLDDEVLEKPIDDADAASMLRKLSGRQHTVLTGICLLHDAGEIRNVASTAVEFHQLSDAEINAYVASGEPRDKAGAYGVQGLASKFVHGIEGCYFNVVGLPVSLVYRNLQQIRSPE